MKRHSLYLLRANEFLVLAFLLLLQVPANAQSSENKRIADSFGIPQEQRKEILASMKAVADELQIAVDSPEKGNQFQAKLRKAIAYIDANSNQITTNGNKLPVSFTDLFFPNKSNTTDAGLDWVKSGFMGIKSDHFVDQYTLILAGFLIDKAPEILLPLLQERAKVSPPTAADYLLYGSVLTALDDNQEAFGVPGKVPLSRSVALLQLAQAQNPIYRLLAAKAAGYVEHDNEKRLNFYSTYVGEADPHIVSSVIDSVSTEFVEFKTPAAINILQSSRRQPRRRAIPSLRPNFKSKSKGLNK